MARNSAQLRFWSGKRYMALVCLLFEFFPKLLTQFDVVAHYFALFYAKRMLFCAIVKLLRLFGTTNLLKKRRRKP